MPRDEEGPTPTLQTRFILPAFVGFIRHPVNNAAHCWVIGLAFMEVLT
jgi:hypothetical protein